MRKLVVARHAKSAWPEGVADAERPLNERGRRDAPRVGAWLAEHVPELDLAVCSPAERAQQTWDLARSGLAREPRVHYERRVHGASVEDLMIVVHGLPNEAHAVLLVGHNPGVAELVYALSGRAVEMKTSALAVLAVDTEWADVGPGKARLLDTVTPRG
ncbi:histidine phosphatase family protein [Haloechinothrix sp. YIM 98757]|uniref:Histidine phosphatase family protein n=1 Tax=Haloechinothrix aidingensis TaxID=2752311 RepID=A0A838ACC5_9PSEU|nr:histidine phosphatase family protein [Haloechinothrix aidingensis]MBA0126916.1 histidine phosphatase family protein [Haloechinothrix aidingensis]